MSKILYFIIGMIICYYNAFSKEIFVKVTDSTYKNRANQFGNYTIHLSNFNNKNIVIALNGFKDINTNLSCRYVLKTSDGGDSWECVSSDCPRWLYDSLLNNYRYNKIYDLRYFLYNFINEELIKTYDSGQIGRSRDWGKNWTLEQDTLFNIFKIKSINIFIIDTNKTFGINNQIVEGKGTGYGRIFFSENNFKNWKNIPLTDSLNIKEIKSITRFGDKIYILNNSLNDEYYYFTKTEDNGNNWTSFKFPYKINSITGNLLYFLNETTGWVILYHKDSTIYKISLFFTDDGGNNWNKISDTEAKSFIPYRINFFDRNYGLMVYYNQCWITEDGGKNWNDLRCKNYNKIPFGIDEMTFIKRDEILCVSSYGVIFKLIITDE